MLNKNVSCKPNSIFCSISRRSPKGIQARDIFRRVLFTGAAEG